MLTRADLSYRNYILVQCVTRAPTALQVVRGKRSCIESAQDCIESTSPQSKILCPAEGRALTDTVCIARIPHMLCGAGTRYCTVLREHAHEPSHQDSADGSISDNHECAARPGPRRRCSFRPRRASIPNCHGNQAASASIPEAGITMGHRADGHASPHSSADARLRRVRRDVRHKASLSTHLISIQTRRCRHTWRRRGALS